MAAMRDVPARGAPGAQEVPEATASEASRRPQQTIRRILVPLDGSTYAECALPHAVAIAKAFGSRICLLSVGVARHRGVQPANVAEWRIARAESQAYLELLAGSLRAEEIEADCECAEGRASEQILRSAAERGADLIVLSSHGEGGITDFHMSGTVSKVLEAAPSSLLVVRANKEPAAPPVPLYSHVMVPVDCTRRSDFAVHVGSAIARAQGAKLVLATVITPPEILGDPRDWAERHEHAVQLVRLNREYATRYLDRLASQVASEKLVIEPRVIDAEHVVKALQQLAEGEPRSLVALSAHGGHAGTGWLHGYVPALLLGHSSSPVLVLQDVTRGRWTGPMARARGSNGGS
jgi:nucleotide-binding universal stress UspA family protein